MSNVVHEQCAGAYSRIYAEIKPTKLVEFIAVLREGTFLGDSVEQQTIVALKKSLMAIGLAEISMQDIVIEMLPTPLKLERKQALMAQIIEISFSLCDEWQRYAFAKKFSNSTPQFPEETLQELVEKVVTICGCRFLREPKFVLV